MTQLLDHHETSDTYVGELFRCGNHRVAVCRDGIQWLFQRQTNAGSLAGPRWRSFGYFTTRAALNRAWTAKFGSAPAAMSALPTCIRRTVQ